MSETFTAAIVEKFGPELVIGQLDLPEPGAHQALVKNLASGICHTDLHAAEGDWPVKPEIMSSRFCAVLMRSIVPV